MKLGDIITVRWWLFQGAKENMVSRAEVTWIGSLDDEYHVKIIEGPSKDRILWRKDFEFVPDDIPRRLEIENARAHMVMKMRTQ